MKINIDDSHLKLQEVREDGSTESVWTNPMSEIKPKVYQTSLKLLVKNKLFFQALFSLHKVSESPHQLTNGLWNCSTHAHYESFRRHLDCNQRQECEGMEDETWHCQHFHPHCGPGAFAFQV
jgi:hypothetical protein